MISKECIEQIEKISQVSLNPKSCASGMKEALTNPQIYESAGLIKKEKKSDKDSVAYLIDKLQNKFGFVDTDGLDTNYNDEPSGVIRFTMLPFTSNPIATDGTYLPLPLPQQVIPLDEVDDFVDWKNKHLASQRQIIRNTTQLYTLFKQETHGK